MKKDDKLFGDSNYLQKNPVLRYLGRLLDRRILNQLEPLITRASDFGLPKNDVENALIDIEYNEFEESFEIVTQQLYEYEIKIDKEFYDSAMEICETLKLDKQKYNFLKNLIE
jgi:hypothetical protein